MTTTRITLDKAAVERGFATAPKVMERNIRRFLSRGAQDVAREERRQAPKAFSTLTQSIRVDEVGFLHFRVATGTNYAVHVAEGRFPGRQPGTSKGLVEWVKQKTGLSGKPLDRAAFVIALAIGRRGIKPNAFDQRTMVATGGRVIELEGTAAGLKEIFG